MTAKEQKRQPISTGSEWTFELIQAYDREISRIAAGYALDTYPNQIEVITAEQMMDAYASVGMPLGYHHWSTANTSSVLKSPTRVARWGWPTKS
jgi:stage V sporulation protein R